jgi:hypothetical protein
MQVFGIEIEIEMGFVLLSLLEECSALTSAMLSRPDPPIFIFLS